MSVWEMDNSHRQGNHDAGLSISTSVEIEATVLTTLLCTHDEKDPLSTRTMSDIRLSACAGVGLSACAVACCDESLVKERPSLQRLSLSGPLSLLLRLQVTVLTSGEVCVYTLYTIAYRMGGVWICDLTSAIGRRASHSYLAFINSNMVHYL